MTKKKATLKSPQVVEFTKRIEKLGDDYDTLVADMRATPLLAAEWDELTNGFLNMLEAMRDEVLEL